MKKFFIVGMPASGKSRLGKYISSITNLIFLDLDNEIEKKLDTRVKDIFKINGENFFRKKSWYLRNGYRYRKDKNNI